MSKQDQVNHPGHYGGKDNPYEVIKVIEAWGLSGSFCLGNVLKYLGRLGKKGDYLEQLKKAKWYLDREVARIEQDVRQPTDNTPTATVDETVEVPEHVWDGIKEKIGSSADNVAWGDTPKGIIHGRPVVKVYRNLDLSIRNVEAPPDVFVENVFVHIPSEPAQPIDPWAVLKGDNKHTT